MLQLGVHFAVLLSAYAILWFICLFCLLPVGLGSERDPDSGAPLKPMLGRKMLIATGLSAIVWLAFYAAIAFGVFDL